MSALEVRLPDDQLDALAARVAELLPTAPEGWLNVRQAADYLACKPDRIHDLVAAGRLAHVREGRRILTKRSWCDDLLERDRRAA